MQIHIQLKNADIGPVKTIFSHRLWIRFLSELQPYLGVCVPVWLQRCHVSVSLQKKQFLEEALKSLSVDVVQILQDQIKVMQNADNLAADADIANYSKALDTILEYVGDIDIANGKQTL